MSENSGVTADSSSGEKLKFGSSVLRFLVVIFGLFSVFGMRWRTISFTSFFTAMISISSMDFTAD